MSPRWYRFLTSFAPAHAPSHAASGARSPSRPSLLCLAVPLAVPAGVALSACSDAPVTVAQEKQVVGPKGEKSSTIEHVPVTTSVKLGGKDVSAETLKHGREVYVHYCRACHGDDGDGRGASSVALRPPPRDFRQGFFKFGSVAGGLPSDDDFRRIVKYGLKGTAMLPWDIVDQDLEAVIQYIKTFSPKWSAPVLDAKGKQIAGFKQGDRIVPAKPDPWTDKGAEGIERGRFVYHQKAQCGSCHPNYATRADLSGFAKKDTGADITEFRDDMYGSQLKESQYKVFADSAGKGGQFLKLLPPDFTRHEVRSVRVQSKSQAMEDLYRVIAGGIYGTPMPTWKGVFDDDDVWAMAHFVYSLIELKGTPAAAQLHERLDNQPKWVPPPPPPEPEAAAPSASASVAGAASAAPPPTAASAAPSAKPAASANGAAPKGAAPAAPSAKSSASK